MCLGTGCPSSPPWDSQCEQGGMCLETGCPSSPPWDSQCDVEVPALDCGKHSKKSNNTRLKSNRFIWQKKTISFRSVLLLRQVE